MRVLLDTNIIIDALISREPFREAAEEILFLSASSKLQSYVTANAFLDIYYVCRKHIPEVQIRNMLEIVFDSIRIAAVTELDCAKSLESSLPDLEDAVMYECAQKINADYLITRDKELTNKAQGLKTITPEAFLHEVIVV